MGKVWKVRSILTHVDLELAADHRKLVGHPKVPS